jgi:RND superfamily putative drug exporter
MTVQAPPDLLAEPAKGLPAPVFERLGRLVVRRRRAVLVLAAAFLAFAGIWGTGVFGALVGGGFDDPASESSRAVAAIEADLGRDAADVVVVYRVPEGTTIDEPAYRRSVTQTLAALPDEKVVRVVDFWSTGGAPVFANADRTATYAALELAGATVEAREQAYRAIADDLVAPGVETLRGGQVPVSLDVNEQVARDIARAETLSIPILIALLAVVFGSLAAAGLPLLVGAFGVLGAFTLLNVVAQFAEVNIFALNIVTMLGLGLAIDYALFIVSRFREELHSGREPHAAAVRTVETAGRTVAFSGVTVAVSLAALTLFPQNFLRSMGLGGMFAVLAAMTAALTVLPAVLAAMGHRVDALKLPWYRRTLESQNEGAAWARVARWVMRRPVAVVVACTALLLVLGAPFLQVAFGGVDHRVLPTSTESRIASESLASQFPASAATPIQVHVSGVGPAEAAGYAETLGALPGAVGAEVVAQAGAVAHLQVGHLGEANGDSALALVDAVRAAEAPAGAEVLVGGQSAQLTDLLDGLGGRLPWVALVALLVTLALLFLAFGSVVLPIKAVLMNALSLTATFGVVVWIFQLGHGADILGVTPTGTTEATQPILMLAIAFGLSMDYEVFLLSRMREEWDRTGDNARAVERGLARTGRIITSAALLFVVVVGAFSFSGISFISMIGVGLVVAVVVDATVVRALLVPATMKLMGRWNWWAPVPMARWWERHGFREESARLQAADRG